MESFFNRILTQLELASHTQAANPEFTSASADTSGEPKISGAPHLAFRSRWNAARSDEGRREVIGEALTELRSLRYSRHPKVDRETLEGKLAIGRDPRPASIVGHAYGYSERHVCRLRAFARDYDRKSA